MAAVLLLWPFEFSSPTQTRRNGASWTERGGGVEFLGVGLVRSRGDSAPLRDALIAGSGFSIEVLAESAGTGQSGPARIVGSSHGLRRRNFTLGQEGDALVIRLRTESTNLDGKPELEITGVFAKPGLRHLVLTYDGSRERVYVDGALRGQTGLRSGGFDTWDPRHRLLLGNEATGTRPWRGRIERLGLYARALSEQEVAELHARAERGDRMRAGLVALYTFAAGAGVHIAEQSGRHPGLELEIPTRVVIGERELLTVNDRGDATDRLVNLLAFVPFGILASRGVGRRRIHGALLLLGFACYALAIESTQYLLAARASSLIDATLNLTGCALGLALGWAIRTSRPAGPGHLLQGEKPER